MEEFNVAHDSFCVLLDSLQQCEHAESSIKECLSMIDDMQRLMRREIGKRDQAALRVHKLTTELDLGHQALTRHEHQRQSDGIVDPRDVLGHDIATSLFGRENDVLFCDSDIDGDSVNPADIFLREAHDEYVRQKLRLMELEHRVDVVELQSEMKTSHQLLQRAGGVGMANQRCNELLSHTTHSGHLLERWYWQMVQENQALPHVPSCGDVPLSADVLQSDRLHYHERWIADSVPPITLKFRSRRGGCCWEVCMRWDGVEGHDGLVVACSPPIDECCRHFTHSALLAYDGIGHWIRQHVWRSPVPT